MSVLKRFTRDYLPYGTDARKDEERQVKVVIDYGGSRQHINKLRFDSMGEFFKWRNINHRVDVVQVMVEADREPEKCRDCGGDGSNMEQSPEDPSQLDQVQCRSCGGRGMV